MERRKLFPICILVLVVATSGCISGGDASLNKNFDTGHEDISFNSSAGSLLDNAFSQNYSVYEISSEFKVLMRTPVAPMRLNLSSEGVFNKSYSNTTSITSIGFGLGESSKDSPQPVKNIETYPDRTETEIVNMENSSEKISESLSRKELGLSVSAVDRINFRNSTVLGTTGENSSEILVKIQPDKEDLLENYADIFEVHVVSDDEASTDDEQELSSFEEAKAYAWISRGNGKIKRFSYFGSAAEEDLQVRADINFTY
ncbi:hypothetical protein [Candidatus Nanohalovita haloferacivicina]|uniref:hypothetical protein n=1 Tax=Candidatus Nanohalovita haloferacivicina TaxID=2978046 RepID=UPI00325FB895|nr:hypothetical protein HBNXNv_0370 [Candidatus Nanohalobia archaeon BNXNv]